MSIRRSQATGLVLMAVMSHLALPASASTSVSFYLEADGEPDGSLTTAVPPDVVLANYESGRDANAQGLYLDQGDKGLAETNPEKYQQWSVAPGQLEISGMVTLRVWLSAKDFHTNKNQVIDLYLLDCSSSCSLIAQARDSFVSGAGFVQRDIDFGTINHTVAAGHTLRVRIMVPNASADDMWVAYWTATYPARLLIPIPPAPTTTTTSTTTTTTPTSTTMTTIQSTTTTSAAVTSTSVPSFATPTSTPTPGSSTTTSETTTSTAEEGTIMPSDTQSRVVSTRPLGPFPDARPVRAAPDQSTLLVSYEGSSLADGLGVPARKLNPQQGLMVSFLTAAETIRSQLLASIALGTLGAILLMAAIRRKSQQRDR